MSANPKPEPDPDRFESATDQVIAACGGDARLAVAALIVTNEFLESEVCELTLNRRPSRPYISYKMAGLTSPGCPAVGGSGSRWPGPLFWHSLSIEPLYF
jgi:hypothetical protein